MLPKAQIRLAVNTWEKQSTLGVVLGEPEAETYVCQIRLLCVQAVNTQEIYHAI